MVLSLFVDGDSSKHFFFHYVSPKRPHKFDMSKKFYRFEAIKLSVDYVGKVNKPVFRSIGSKRYSYTYHYEVVRLSTLYW